MSNSVDATLQDAFDLIEQNQLEEARTILEPLLQSDSDNPAVWWIYAHAVETPEEGNQALDKVLQLDPTYPGASDLKTQIATSQEPVADDVDDWDDLEFEPDNEFAESATAETKKSPLRFLMFAVVVIIVVVAIFAILSGVFGSSTPPPTEIASADDTQVPTVNSQVVATEIQTEESATDQVEPTDVPATEIVEITEAVEPTEISPTDEPVATTVPPSEEPTDIPPTDMVEITEEADSFTASIVTALSDYNVADTDIEVRSTLLGETLVAKVCAAPGPESSLVLNGVMDVLVASNSTMSDDVEAIAVSLVDCTNDEGSIRTIGVERTIVQQLSTGEIELKDFQRAWQPLP